MKDLPLRITKPPSARVLHYQLQSALAELVAAQAELAAARVTIEELQKTVRTALVILSGDLEAEWAVSERRNHINQWKHIARALLARLDAKEQS